jgi:hypothetical protein
LEQVTGIDLIDLPSSSAALTRPFAEKLLAWDALARFAALPISATVSE